jgi:hypothetical protein
MRVERNGSSDRQWATSFALSVIDNADLVVRGNAVLALGHIARIHGRIDQPMR